MSARSRSLTLILLASILAASCTTTKMLQSWTLPGFDKKGVKKVLVLGVSPNPSLRRLYEDSFSVKLENLGYQAVSGYLWAPDGTSLDKQKDAIIARMKKEGVTHVLVTRLASAKEITTIHAPATVSVGYGWGPSYYGSWSSYYSVGYTAMASPGYTTVDNVVTLETNFYDASREKDALVWSGESETWTDTGESGKKVDEVIQAIVSRMRSNKAL